MAPDQDRMRRRLEQLERIDRPSASEGERRAAEWLVERFAELGAEARIEAEDAHGTYWWPLGIGAALGALGGILGLRGRRLLGGAIAAAAAAGMASDFPPGKRLLRRLLPRLAALGALSGRRLLSKLGILFGAGSAAAMAEIGARDVVPGANDNGTAVVALLELAERLLAEPPQGLRVILLSVGSEESFSEGMKAFGERHFGELPRESAFFLCLETLGSPHLLVLRGEGFLRMREYPPRSLALLDGLAGELGIPLFPNLRLRNGTDGLESLAAGYETAVLASCTDLKQPANYHWPRDLAENVDFDTLADAVRLSEATIRRLDDRWL